MPIAAGVVSYGFIVAAIAPFQMSAQCGCTADITQNFALLARDDMAPALKKVLLMSAKDIGHFKPMFAHRVRWPP